VYPDRPRALTAGRRSRGRFCSRGVDIPTRFPCVDIPTSMIPPHARCIQRPQDALSSLRPRHEAGPNDPAIGSAVRNRCLLLRVLQTRGNNCAEARSLMTGAYGEPAFVRLRPPPNGQTKAFLRDVPVGYHAISQPHPQSRQEASP